MNAAREILERLLKTQKQLQHPDDPNYELIKEEELKAIRKIWYKNWGLGRPCPFHLQICLWSRPRLGN